MTVNDENQGIFFRSPGGKTRCNVYLGRGSTRRCAPPTRPPLAARFASTPIPGVFWHWQVIFLTTLVTFNEVLDDFVTFWAKRDCGSG